MRFAELTVGRVIQLGPASLTEDEIVEYARAYDPQWFHTDPARAATSQWHGLIASGWQTCGIAMRLVADAALHGSESLASPGLAYVKWPGACAPTVLEMRTARSQPTLGILRWRWQLFNAGGVEVLDLEATSLFALDPATTP